MLGNEIAFIKTYIFPDETTVTIFEDLFSGFKIIKVNGEWVNDISSAPKDNIQKTFLRNVRLDDLQIWNFTKNKFSSHCYNFCKISDLEDPIAVIYYIRFSFFQIRETKFNRALKVHFLSHFYKKLLPLSHTES